MDFFFKSSNTFWKGSSQSLSLSKLVFMIYPFFFFFPPLYYYFMLVWSTYLSVGMDQKLKLDIWFFFFLDKFYTFIPEYCVTYM